jgi:hypothetical protein
VRRNTSGLRAPTFRAPQYPGVLVVRPADGGHACGDFSAPAQCTLTNFETLPVGYTRRLPVVV